MCDRFGCFQVIVRNWNANEELFECISKEEEERYVGGVRNNDFDGNLGPYPIEWCQRWKELSQFISKEVIERIEVNYPGIYV